MNYTKELARDIEKMMANGEVDIIDAICHWCEIHNVDVESVATLIKRDPVIKSKIELHARSVNILEKSAHLPI